MKNGSGTDAPLSLALPPPSLPPIPQSRVRLGEWGTTKPRGQFVVGFNFTLQMNRRSVRHMWCYLLYLLYNLTLPVESNLKMNLPYLFLRRRAEYTHHTALVQMLLPSYVPNPVVFCPFVSPFPPPLRCLPASAACGLFVRVQSRYQPPPPLALSVSPGKCGGMDTGID